MPRYDDEDTPSTRRERLSESDATALFNRKAAEALSAQQAKLQEFLDERDRRAEERQRYEQERRRKEREISGRLEKLDERISDLYTLDRRDVDALARLQKDVETTRADMKTVLEAVQGIKDERNQMAGFVKGIRGTIAVAIAVTGAVSSIFVWLLTKVFHI